MQALDDLVRWGKVRYVGASNFRAWQLGLALGASNKVGITRFVCDQPRYNILWRDIESDLLPLCRDQGITHAAISWVLAQEGITSAIVGASRVEQIEDSLRHAEVQLTQEDLEFCDQAWYQIPRPTDPAVAIR